MVPGGAEPEPLPRPPRRQGERAVHERRPVRAVGHRGRVAADRVQERPGGGAEAGAAAPGRGHRRGGAAAAAGRQGGPGRGLRGPAAEGGRPQARHAAGLQRSRGCARQVRERRRRWHLEPAQPGQGGEGGRPHPRGQRHRGQCRPLGARVQEGQGAAVQAAERRGPADGLRGARGGGRAARRRCEEGGVHGDAAAAESWRGIEGAPLDLLAAAAGAAAARPGAGAPAADSRGPAAAVPRFGPALQGQAGEALAAWRCGGASTSFGTTARQVAPCLGHAGPVLRGGARRDHLRRRGRASGQCGPPLGRRGARDGSLL
mmetsp:Transcript_28549/g.77357  ORF Transcript_28549/g.77357 Transcript_28549/m.77357 type:complete len:317 (+) Transcript_28549:658-1608(+)